MSYLYSDAEHLEGQPVVHDGRGNYFGECVSLVKKYTHAPLTSEWREGVRARGNPSLRKGTAIATFVGGRYPTNSSHHAALYLSQDETGIYVIEQDRSLHAIRKRKILFKGSGGHHLVNDGDAYSVIE